MRWSMIFDCRGRERFEEVEREREKNIGGGSGVVASRDIDIFLCFFSGVPESGTKAAILELQNAATPTKSSCHVLLRAKTRLEPPRRGRVGGRFEGVEKKRVAKKFEQCRVMAMPLFVLRALYRAPPAVQSASTLSSTTESLTFTVRDEEEGRETALS